MAHTDTRRALRQIADVLGMPVSAFTDPQATGAPDPLIDVAELLRLFDRIPNEQKRRECIEFVRALAL